MPNDMLRDVSLIAEALEQAANTFRKIIEVKRQRQESILNDEPIEEQKTNRDWEIVSLKDTLSGDVYPFTSMPDKRFHIHSVKRLSDGEVFTVGDIVFYKAWNGIKGYTWEIDHFFIRGDKVLLVRSKDCEIVEEFNSQLFKLQQYDNQPLSGELITKEECERREKNAFFAGRMRIGGFWNDSIKNWTFSTYNDYKK